MRLKVLGSSSLGNCYILQGENEKLIIEAGVKYSDILQGIDFKVKDVVGCLISHEHGDHAKSVQKLASAGIDIYSSEGTFRALEPRHHRYKSVEKLKIYKIGAFSILPFGIEHDCNEGLGFLIKHDEMGVMLFATDTYYLVNKFPKVNHFLIECNYSEKILTANIESGRLDRRRAKRVRRSHFALRNLKVFFQSNDLSEARNIILLHLSDSNSNEKEFEEEILNLTTVSTTAAKKGQVFDLKPGFF